MDFIGFWIHMGQKKGWSVDMVLYSVKVWYNNEILGKMVIVLVCYGTKWL